MHGTQTPFPSSSDRDQIAAMHSLGKQRPPSSMRDMSDSMTVRNGDAKWKKSPTVVQTPTNHSTPFVNPFSSRMGSNLRGGSRPQGVNNSGRTVLDISQSKKPRIDTEKQQMTAPLGPIPVREFYPKPNGMGSKSTRSAGPSSNAMPSTSKDVIEVLDDDTPDIGQRVKRQPQRRVKDRIGESPDPLDSLTPEPSHSKFSNDLHDFETYSHSAPSRRFPRDGDHTRRLQERIQTRKVVQVDDDSDSIESTSGFPLPPSGNTAPPSGKSLFVAGNVKQKVESFEKSSKQPRRLDFNEIAKVKANVKGKMKSKSNLPQKLDPLSGISGFEHHKESSARKNQMRSSEDIILPLEQWSRGYELFCNQDEANIAPSYWLTLSPDSRLLAIRGVSSAPDPTKGRPLHEFRLDRDIDTFTYSTPSQKGEPMILRIKPSARNFKYASPTDKHKPGSNQDDGFITFKFMTRHPNWQNGDQYSKLLETLKVAIRKSEVVTGSGSKSVWEMVLNAAHLKEPEIERKGVAAFAHEREDMVASSSKSEAKPNSRPKPQAAFKGSTTSTLPGARPTRQSTRLSAHFELKTGLETEPEPEPEPDELILVYPPTGPGAINIYKSDLKRLDEGSYLNDTLIEFGLKLWLADLKADDPSFAEQVHVFSSFFYKKINVKDKDEGYQSVRKWTSKFDIFQKKYIVVPINENFHWYLAIICNPEFVLVPAPVSESAPKPMTRKRKREDASVDATTPDRDARHTNARPRSPEIIPDSNPTSPQRSPPLDSEGDVEDLLHVTHSCTLSDNNLLFYPEDLTSVDQSSISEPSHINNTDAMDVDCMELQYPTSPLRQPDNMDVDEVSSLSTLVDREKTEIDTHDGLETSLRSRSNNFSPIRVSKFYGKGSSSQKGEKAPRASTGSNQESREDGVDELDVSADTSGRENTTYVFIFDSLGSRHPQAGKTLSRYLQLEAKDKKGINASEAKWKNALVPSQPNYCDCGVYVLHFVRQFLRAPDTYSNIILSLTSKNYPARDRKTHWKDSSVKGLREDIRGRILQLSETWKSDRGTKVGEKETAKANEVGGATSMKHGDSDDVVVIQD
ncbi:uncharacterized protein FIBRA_04556 [Fibroporia radiculosa]|uniref:Ubiquitin-like protease family profile domain-containing protein n=1 Tax=Fibroporia radiculosa TaxID=599839 RepID=J4HWL2_9APHY|nr:uncharacterized protein FIBRA_04556 [Fibroporia radiculosa]CCM02457.1 predicted protein [Fibroporia radiculosa]